MKEHGCWEAWFSGLGHALGNPGPGSHAVTYDTDFIGPEIQQTPPRPEMHDTGGQMVFWDDEDVFA